MARLPFDPAKMASAAPTTTPAVSPPAHANDRPISVSMLCEMVESALRRGTPTTVRVTGEVSNFNDRTHWYFALKDSAARVDCVMFTAALRKAGFTPSNGQEVVASGRVGHYAPQGRTQLYVERLEPVGAGALDLRYRQLVEELRGLGWFAEERKRPMPRFPRRVAVVTSRTGAALQDVLDTMRRRCPAVGALLCDVRVQGEGAAGQIAATLDRLSREHESLGIDAVVLTRGGGSMEDLWAFNDRTVAQAVVRCAVPVVAAIGHETDTTIAELVADARAATPTQAAMRVTPDRAALVQQTDHQNRRLRNASRATLTEARRTLEEAERAAANAMTRRVSAAQVRVERLSSRLSARRPEAEYSRRRERLADAESRLRHAMFGLMRRPDLLGAQRRLTAGLRAATARGSARIDGLSRALELASPINVLRRGYSVTLLPGGALLRTAADARPGATIETRVVDGVIRSTVTSGEAGGPTHRDTRGGPRSRSDPPSQICLFQ